MTQQAGASIHPDAPAYFYQQPHNPMFDFHTHRLDATPGTAIVCLPQSALLHPADWLDQSGRLPHADAGARYAAGIHPWWLAHPHFDLTAHLEGLRRLLVLPEVVQLGECGLDTLLGEAGLPPAPIEQQEEVFMAQAALSEELAVPMTLHCVRAYDRLLRLHRQLHPTQQWTLHGFRGKPVLARQLLAAGFNLSFGPRRNDESYALTPPDRRHDETDAE